MNRNATPACKRNRPLLNPKAHRSFVIYLMLMLVMQFAIGSPQQNTPALLSEIIVVPKKTQIKNKDTLTYQAADLHPTKGQLLTTLLKKIPGFDIGKDGTVLFQGKAVDALLVEGDDLLNSNYRLLAANLPADMIDKVQIIDRYYPDPLLKGLLPGDQKAVNIILKKSYRKPLSGNAISGAGLNDRFYQRLSLASFSGTLTALSFHRLGNSDDLSNHYPSSQINEPAIVNEGIHPTPAFTRINGLEYLENGRTNGTLSEKINHHALTFIKKLPSGIRLKGTGWFLKNEADLSAPSASYSPAPEEAVLSDFSRLYRKYPSGGGRLNLAIPTGQKIKVELNSVLQISRELTGSDTGSFYDDDSPASSSASPPAPSLFYSPTASLVSSDILQRHSLRITGRPNRHSALQGELAFGRESRFEQLGLKKQLQPEQLRIGLHFPLNQLIRYISPNQSAWLYYTCLFDRWQLIFHVESFRDTRWLQTALLDKEFQVFAEPFRNNEKEISKSAKAGFGITRLLGTQWRLSAGISGFHHTRRSVSVAGGTNPLTVTRTDFTPSFNLRWKNNRHGLSLDYSREKRWAGLPEFYTHYIFRDPQTLVKSILPQAAYPVIKGTARYTYTNLPEKLLAWLQFDFIRNNKELQPKAAGKEFVVVHQLPAAKNGYLTWSAGLDKYLASLFTGIRINGTFLRSNTRFSIANPSPADYSSSTSNCQLSFRSAFRGRFNYHLGTELTNRYYSPSNSSIQFRQTELMNFLDMDWDLPLRVKARASAEQRLRKVEGKKWNPYYFLNIQLSYTLRSDKWSLFLSGKRISHARLLTELSFEEYRISVQRFSPEPGYLMIGVQTRF